MWMVITPEMPVSWGPSLWTNNVLGDPILGDTATCSSWLIFQWGPELMPEWMVYHTACSVGLTPFMEFYQLCVWCQTHMVSITLVSDTVDVIHQIFSAVVVARTADHLLLLRPYRTQVSMGTTPPTHALDLSLLL